jgi:hypothetical protein
MAIAAEEVTQWAVRLGHDDRRAADILWEKYFSKLVRYARRKLDGIACRAVNKEDVALSAMNSVCQGRPSLR